MSTPTTTATVMVGGEQFTGTIYHVRDNGWPCVTTPEGTCASGPTQAPDIANCGIGGPYCPWCQSENVEVFDVDANEYNCGVCGYGWIED